MFVLSIRSFDTVQGHDETLVGSQKKETSS